MSNFLELVAKERTRQIIEKGYTAEHDDKHTDGSIANAAACYAATGKEIVRPIYDRRYGILAGVHPLWPWEPEYLKKQEHDRKQQLIIAAAFINAEYDRIIRVEKKDTRCRGCNYLLSKDHNTWCGLTGMSMNEDDTQCDLYCLPPFEASEDNPLLKSFMRSSRE